MKAPRLSRKSTLLHRRINAAVFFIAVCCWAVPQGNAQQAVQVAPLLDLTGEPQQVPVQVQHGESAFRTAALTSKTGAPPAGSAKLVVARSPTKPTSFATPQMVAWLTKLIRDNLPPTYEDDRKWGKTKKVWNGVRLRREGFKLETERRIRTVNTGTWTRYKIDLVDPDRLLHVQFDRLEPLDNGDISFRVVTECTLDLFGRLSQWARDVQVISISMNADAICRLTLEGTVGVKMNMFKFPPDLALKPHVDVAHVDLVHYRVRRISQLGGDFAKVLGKGLRSAVDDKLEDFNNKLVGKINKQLDKQADKLSFSSQEWLKSKLPLPAKKTAANASSRVAK
ncbi:MAG: hypothetical protein Aurels2KO_49520 [Aureliella sp.]